MTTPRRAAVASVVLVSTAFLAWWLSQPRLPPTYSPSEFMPENGFSEPPVDLGHGPRGELLILAPTFGPSSFSSGHNYLGLYDRQRELTDEEELGSVPLRLLEWTDGVIRLRNVEPSDPEYCKLWTEDATQLGPYALEVECR